MGRCWSIASSSLKKFEEVSEWLLAQPGWKIRAGFEKDEQRTIVRYGSTFNAILMSLDAKRGVANQLSSHLNQFLVKPDFFESKSIASLLPSPFEVCERFD
jgi:hypothetical protein